MQKSAAQAATIRIVVVCSFFEQVNRPAAPFNWNYEGLKSKA
jgi:hypothetical protein